VAKYFNGLREPEEQAYNPSAEAQNGAMLREPEKQFSLTRAALITGGRTRANSYE
jgi:hypothetical protein